MTVIATIITSRYTAHASDSFITERQKDGTFLVKETQQTKLVRVEAWRGAMAYWGLAYYGKWNTLDWLRAKASDADKYPSAQAFAEALAAELTTEANYRLRSAKMGIGIHFTAYEYVNGYWIPELFLISNWIDVSYNSCRPAFTATRETFGAHVGIEERSKGDANPNRRLAVHSALHNDKALLYYNNGDTSLFNPIARSVFGTFALLLQRGQFRDPASVQTHLSLVRRPVEIASKLISDFGRPGSILIGGKPHDLAISPGGQYHTTTGG
jgi:hypothetical protein